MHPDNSSAERANHSLSAQSPTFVWKQVPKNLVVILLLEVITVYGLLFFIAPNSSVSTQASETNIEQITVNTIFQLTNSARNQHSITPLAFNAELSKAAQAKATYILENNSFAHNASDGSSFSTWVKQTDYDYVRVAENLAINYDNPQDVLDAWLNSPTHRRNVLNPLYNDIGLAVLKGTYHNKETIVVVQLFGSTQ